MRKKKWIIIAVVCALALLIHFHRKVQNCSLSPCNAAQAEMELGDKLDLSVPLFLKNDNSATLISKSPRLQNNKAFEKMLNRISGAAARVSPIEQPSCAIVGNSQNLLGSKYGARIDKHDYVFRMNSAPIASYEEDVGTKTTHHIFNWNGHYQGGKVHIYGPDTINILIPLPRVTDKHAFHVLNDYIGYQPFLMKLTGDINKPQHESAEMRDVPNLVMVHPEFMWYAAVKWFTPPNRRSDEAPSKGLFTTIMAIHMCDKIDLFGFGKDKNGAWGHYFSPEVKTKSIHRPTYQDKLLNLMEAAGVIKQYQNPK